MLRHKVLCRDREWPQQGLYCRDRVGTTGPWVLSDIWFFVATEFWRGAKGFLS